MTPVFDLASRIVEENAASHPIVATYQGVPGHDHRMSDWSPAARGRPARAGPRLAGRARHPAGRERRRPARGGGHPRAARVPTSRRTRRPSTCATSTCCGARCSSRATSSPSCPRRPTSTGARSPSGSRPCPGRWGRAIAAYAEGIARDVLPARRQVLGAATVAAVCAGLEPGAGRLADAVVRGLRRGLRRGRRRARRAAARGRGRGHRGVRGPRDLAARRLRAGGAAEADGVGRDRYVRMARVYLGADIDPEETYAWALGRAGRRSPAAWTRAPRGSTAG